MKRIIREIDQEDIFCMANLYPKRTGLPVLLWIDNLGCVRNTSYNFPRIKVQNVRGDRVVDDFFVVSLESDPKVLSEDNKLSAKDWKTVKDYIKDNLSTFLDHWNQIIDEDELKDILYSRR